MRSDEQMAAQISSAISFRSGMEAKPLKKALWESKVVPRKIDIRTEEGQTVKYWLHVKW